VNIPTVCEPGLDSAQYCGRDIDWISARLHSTSAHAHCFAVIHNDSIIFMLHFRAKCLSS